VAGINGKYPTAATALSSGGTGVIDHPQAGQKAACAAISAAQCGHSTVAGVELTGTLVALFIELSIELFTELFTGLDDSPSIVFPSAIFAHTINLKSVAGGYVMVLVSNFVFDFPDFLREKFHRSSTFRAHHVVMTTPVVLVFVTRNAIVKGDFASESAARQKLQRAIDSSEPDARIGLLNQPMQFIDGKMLTGFEEGSKDGVALPSLLQANAFEMLKKDAFGFADILPRNGQLIVDSLLQHVGRHGTRRLQQHNNGEPLVMLPGELTRSKSAVFIWAVSARCRLSRSPRAPTIFQ
jgi:hypothetical protein